MKVAALHVRSKRPRIGSVTLISLHNFRGSPDLLIGAESPREFRIGDFGLQIEVTAL